MTFKVNKTTHLKVSLQMNSVLRSTYFSFHNTNLSFPGADPENPERGGRRN